MNLTQSDLNHKIEQAKQAKLKELRQRVHLDTDNGFWEFCKFINPMMFKDTQTERIRFAEILQNSARWSINRDPKYARYRKIMVNIFPRFAKSYMNSIWCVWILGHFPKGTIMRNAHDATLAEKFSRDIRNMIENTNDEEEEKSAMKSVQSKVLAVFPHLKLSKDKKSLNMWALKSAKDISYFCAGVKGAITGNGCDLAMILDDPVKDPEKAMSETENQNLFDWYLTVHRSRRDRDSEVQGSEIIIMARWSENDLCGQLLNAEDDWLQFTFKAEDSEGNSTCEAIFSTKDVKEMKRGFVNSGRIKWWDALYNQDTKSINKKLLDKKLVKRFNPIDLDFKSGRYDLVAWNDVADSGEDFMSMPIAYFDKMLGQLYIVDWLFTDKASDISIGLVADKIMSNKIQMVIFESNNGGKWYAELVEQALASVGYYNWSYMPVHSSSNKETKILVASSLVISSVYFLEEELIETGSEYYLALNQMFSYEKERKNKHDDAIDSVTSLAKYYCQGNAVQCF